MEAAELPLSEALAASDEYLVDTGHDQWYMKHQLSLDIAAGLQALHSLNLVHGDIKPDNILVFRQQDPDIPYIAKVSDFGLCIDMSAGSIDASVYTGTPNWTGPEVGEVYDVAMFGEFRPDHLKLFDVYSLGMLLLAIFATEQGKSPFPGDTRRERFGEALMAMRMIDDTSGMPPSLRRVLRTAVLSFLQPRPCDRSLSSPDILRTDSESYRTWLKASILKPDYEPWQGRGEMTFNTGSQYWAVVEPTTLIELDRQYNEQICSARRNCFSGSMLLGMAVGYARIPRPEANGKVLQYLRAASDAGHSPARAICERVFGALQANFTFNSETSRIWDKEAISEGYVFHANIELSESERQEWCNGFRSAGGYGSDAFQSKQKLLDVACDVSLLQDWITNDPTNPIIDSDGNRMLHVSAAFGQTSCVRLLLEDPAYRLAVTNDRGETAIFKACQAGHLQVLRSLVASGHLSTLSANGISPLHWLFVFPSQDAEEALDCLLTAGAEIDYGIPGSLNSYRVVGAFGSYSTGPPSIHFPFAWPIGTALHWAVFVTNEHAVEVLLRKGAYIDKTTGPVNGTSTVLAQAAARGDYKMVQLLLEHNADACVLDGLGDNILHALSVGPGEAFHPDRKLLNWIRHGSWPKSRDAYLQTVRLLVQAHASLEHRAMEETGLTPLLQASEDGSRSESVALALINLGADVNAREDAQQTSVLQEWAERDAREMSFPEAYMEIMHALIRHGADVNFRSSFTGETALHCLTKSWASIEQFREVVSLLVTQSETPADINAMDWQGSTPLMSMLAKGIGEVAQQAQILVEFGARPDITSSNGRNVITHILNTQGIGRARRMDAELDDLIKLMTSKTYMSQATLAQLIANTSPEAVATACYEGCPRTLTTLLDLGMSAELNAEVQYQDGEKSMPALSHAFYGAERSRMAFMEHISSFKTAADRERALRNDEPRSTWLWGYGAWGQAGPEREMEAYWAYPEIFKLLQRYGAKRKTITREEWRQEPSFIDVVEIPVYGFTVETQPHREHWQPLYELEMLESGWQKDAFELIETNCRNKELSMTPPNLVFFHIRPQIVECDLAAREQNWYLVELELDTGVDIEVQIIGGKIAGLRDQHGRMEKHDLPPHLRWIWNW